MTHKNPKTIAITTFNSIIKRNKQLNIADNPNNIAMIIRIFTITNISDDFQI